MKNWQANSILFSIGCFGGVGFWIGTNDNLLKVSREQSASEIVNSSRVRDFSHSRSPRVHSSRPNAEDHVIRQKLLNQIFETNPEAIDGFTVQLFDQNLLVDRKEGLFWGLSEDDAKSVSDGMKGIFSWIWSEEFERSSIKQLDNGNLVVYVPALDDQAVKSAREKINELFDRHFLPSLANSLAEKVVAEQRSMFAGISGLSRIIEITPTPDRTFGLTGRGNNIRVTYLDAKMSRGDGFDPNAEFPRGMRARTEEIVERLPLIYAHFFRSENE
jgi:hypothetical protein